MTMPILPSLMGTADAPAAVTLADIIGQLDEDQVAELLTAADAAGFGTEPVDEEVVEDPDAAPATDGDLNEDLEQPEAPTVDTGEAASEEDVDVGEAAGLEGGEEEPAEEEVAEMSELGFDAIGTWADSALEQIDVQYDALVALAKGADADLGADSDALEALVEQADTLREQASEARDLSADAAKSEDARTCALEALKLERCSRVLDNLLQQAHAYAETTDTPEAGPADDPAMKLWAERTMPKVGIL